RRGVGRDQRPFPSRLRSTSGSAVTNLRSFLRLFVPSPATIRLGAYSVFAFSVAALLAPRILRADIGEAGLAAGRQIATLSDLLGDAETLVVNGERMHHASMYTDQDVGTVLDRFENYCASSPGFVGRAMAEFPQELTKKLEKAPRSLRLG